LTSAYIFAGRFGLLPETLAAFVGLEYGFTGTDFTAARVGTGVASDVEKDVYAAVRAASHARADTSKMFLPGLVRALQPPIRPPS